MLLPIQTMGDVSTKEPRLIRVLQAAAEHRKDLRLLAFSEAEILWASETGLGPLLFKTTNADPEATTSPLWTLLQAANMTARVIAAEQLDAMVEIIDACKTRVMPLVLLKGISVCEQYYPEPHLRPMRDIDFLVGIDDFPAVESSLFELGYRQKSNAPASFYEKHHHSMPFFHPGKGIWVEVHRGLFPPRSPLSRDRVFSLENLKSQIHPSEFQGRRVGRLSDELQLVYIASHWAQQFQTVGGMVAMLDVIYLWNNQGRNLDWEKLFRWSSGSIASAYLYVLLSYLDKYRLIDISQETLNTLFLQQWSLGKLNLKMVHSLVDRCYVDGRKYGRALSLRNYALTWEALLSGQSPLISLMLIPWKLVLPHRLKKRFVS